MMLTPEQLAEWRDYVMTAKDTLVPMTKYELCSVLNHIDAQQARISEMEAQLTRIQKLADCGTVQNWLALPDEDKARWFAVTAQRDSEHCKLIAEMEQDAANAAAAERERIKAICGDVIDEWFNCAGGADEVLRRIEEYEQNGEAKP